MRLTISLFFLILLTGCASVHKEITATRNGSLHGSDRLVISAELDNQLSSEYFGMLEFTLENTTGKWLTIERIGVDMDDPEIRQSASFTTGDDFAIWRQTVNGRTFFDQFSRSPARAALIDPVETSAPKSLTIDTLARERTAGQSDLFPAGHLLNGEFRIPPGLFVNAWLLINTTDHDTNNLLSKLDLKVTYDDGKVDEFQIPIFKSHFDLGRHAWQKQIQTRVKKELEYAKTNAGYGSK